MPSSSTAIGQVGEALPSLTDVQAQRVLAVLNELLAKYDILMRIPRLIDRRAINLLGSDLAAEIEAYNQSQEKLQNLWYAESQDGPGSQCESIQSVRIALHHSTRNLCRTFLNSPESYDELVLYNTHNAQSKASATDPQLAANLDSLRTLLAAVKWVAIEKLTRSTRDEEVKKSELQKVIERENKAREELESLRQQLAAARQERTSEINGKNDVIRKLKEELKEIKQTAEEVARKLEQRTKSKDEGEQAQFSEREAVLSGEIKALQSQLDNAIKANREEELLLRKKKFKVENEVDAWIQKYDQDMEERQAEIDDITAIYSEEKTQLEDLQLRYTELQKEFNRLQEERKRMEELRQSREAEQQRLAKCATRIQSLWRGFKIRKLLKEQKEKKKKGGKSGKKKK